MFGGSPGYGSLFKINTNGTGYQIIKNFPAYDSNTHTNNDGAVPIGGLIMSSNRLFGTTSDGGSGGKGNVFSLNTNGTDYSVLNNFNVTNGKSPYTGLILSGSILYGTAIAGGSGISNKGAIFQINTDGSDFGVVKGFTTNDGVLLMSEVTMSANGSQLYGTTHEGGISNRGTIYSIGTNGSGFTTIKSFSEGDGARPRNGLVLSGDTLFGTTEGDFDISSSLVYRVNTDGSGYAVIKRFSEVDDVTGTNYDGSYLWPGGLAIWKGVLYGTAREGGFYGNGVVFKVNPDGTGFAVLKHFAAFPNQSSEVNVGGAYPLSELTVADGVLYGTTLNGGVYGNGTIYSVTIPPTPPLRMSNIASNPLIFWSDDGLNRTLQTTADLGSASWTTLTSLNWTNTSTNPRQIGYQLTNILSTSAAFFRLQ